MDRATGLFHDTQRSIVICMQHGHALVPDSIVTHVRNKHSLRGPLLRQVQDYLESVEGSLLSVQGYPQPPHHSAPVPHVNISPAFACSFPGCERSGHWLTLSRKATLKHVRLQHPGVQKVERKQLVSRLHAQSVFSRPNNKLFIVQSPEETSPIPQDVTARSLSRSTTPHGTAAAAVNETSRLAELDNLHAVSSSTHKSQVPPWLFTSGISTFLQGLDKDEVRRLVSRPACSGEEEEGPSSIGGVVFEALHAASGLVRHRVGRVSARRLNSFEPSRMQSKPFVPVRETATLKRYARSWSSLLTSLVRMQSLPHQTDGEVGGDEESTQPSGWLEKHYALDPALGDEVRGVESFAGEVTRLEEAQEDCAAAKACLLHAVRVLSHALTRYIHSQSTFSNPVVRFCAFKAIGDDGAWVTTQSFAPFLSGLIHCMQLWLVDFCFLTSPPNITTLELDKVIERECMQCLVNISPSAIAELSFWRLLTWRVSEGVIVHPATTIDETKASVRHLHIELAFDTWRQAVRSLTADMESLLVEKLMFGLHAAERYSTRFTFDTPSNVMPGFSFKDDARNDFSQAVDWLLKQVQADSALARSFEVEVSDRTVVVVDRRRFEQYLSYHNDFLSMLIIAVYFTAGLPPRREELVSITWRNWDVARNLYISDGLFTVITGYHKSQWRVGNRPVARFLPLALGDMLLHYLIYVQPFCRWVRHCLGEPPA